MSARLAQASMGEQLFGHAFAGLRFGVTLGELEEAVEIAFKISPVKGAVLEKAHAEAVKILGMVRFIIIIIIIIDSFSLAVCAHSVRSETSNSKIYPYKQIQLV